MNIENLSKTINVLIPDGETLLTLSVIKCLSSIRNINIHILSSKKWYETRFSLHVSSFNYYRSKTDKDFIDKINQLTLSKNIDVILPINVPSIGLIIKNRNLLNVLVTVPTLNNLNIANDKWELAKYLKDANIPMPKTFEVSSIEDIEKLEFPLMLKPKQGWNGKNIIKIDNIETYKKIINKIQFNENYIIQNYIKGYDIDMSVLCNNGKILAFTIQKEYLKNSVLYSPPLGIEFLYKKELFEIIEKLVRNLKWSGVAHIDLRYDKEEKQYKVIEINPRFWGSVEASKKIGVNFPYLYCLAALGICFELPDYQFEKYVNNRGLIKILISKFSFSKSKHKIPKYNALDGDLLDPLPKTFKYASKILNKVFKLKS